MYCLNLIVFYLEYVQINNNNLNFKNERKYNYILTSIS